MTATPELVGARSSSLVRANSWARLILATSARTVLMVLLGMLLWAAAPALIGWQPTTVMTGSMEPRLSPGDVVVSRPVAPGDVRLGQVLLYDDPDVPGKLRMHRYIGDSSDGQLITQGDANPAADSTPIDQTAVHGVGFIKIPYVGTPIVWARTAQWNKLLLLTGALTVIGILSTIDAPLRRTSHDNAKPATPEPRRARHRHARHSNRTQRLGGALIIITIAATGGILTPDEATAAPFTATTTATATITAATATPASSLTCNPAGASSVSIKWDYTGDTPESFSLITGNTVLTTVDGSERTATLHGSGILRLGSTYTLTVRTNLAGTWNASDPTLTTKVRVFSVLGILTGASCAN